VLLLAAGPLPRMTISGGPAGGLRPLRSVGALQGLQRAKCGGKAGQKQKPAGGRAGVVEAAGCGAQALIRPMSALLMSIFKANG